MKNEKSGNSRTAKNNIVLITPVSKDLLYFKIADSIRSYIRLSHLKRGERLPSERELSAQFECGRHSIREALRILQNEGVIRVKIGSGTYIADDSDVGSLYLKLVKVNYMELLSIKTELEKYAIRTAICRGAAACTDGLASVLAELESDATQGRFNSDTDKLFHRRLIEMSGNRMLVQIIEKIIESFDDYAGVLIRSSRICVETIPFHRQIVEALRRSDPEMAARACDRIMQIDSLVLNMLDSRAPGAVSQK